MADDVHGERWPTAVPRRPSMALRSPGSRCASTSFPPDAGAAFTGLFCTSPGPDVAELLENPPRSLGGLEPSKPLYSRRPSGYVSADPVDPAAWHRADAAARSWLSKPVVLVGRHRRRAPVIDYDRLKEYTRQLLLAADYERAWREQDEMDRCIGLATQLDAVDDIAAYVYGVVRVVPAPDDAVLVCGWKDGGPVTDRDGAIVWVHVSLGGHKRWFCAGDVPDETQRALHLALELADGHVELRQTCRTHDDENPRSR